LLLPLALLHAPSLSPTSPHHACSRPCTPQKTVRTMAMRTGVTGGGG
jgi:hypothetical protein